MNTKLFKVVVPTLGANDEFALIASWEVHDKSFVKTGEILCSLETSKANYEIICEFEGYIKICASVGDEVKNGATIAWISPELKNLDTIKEENTVKENIFWTKKAAALAKLEGLDIKKIPYSGKILKEIDVINYINTFSDKFNINIESKLKVFDNSVLIIGAGHGNLSAAGYFILCGIYQPCAFIDYSKENADYFVGNLPVFGIRQIKEIYKTGCTKAFLQLPYNMLEKLATIVENIGFELVNAIHPSASIAATAKLGKSVMVGPNAVIDEFAVINSFSLVGNCSIIGCNTIIGFGSKVLNGASVAHDSIVGKGTSVSDGARIAGRVNLGDEVLVGLNVCINMDVKVGNNSILVSGASILSDVPANSLYRLDGKVISK